MAAMTMKREASEMVLPVAPPVQAAPGAAPDEGESSCASGEPATGHVAQPKGSVRSWLTDAIVYAQAQALSAKAQAVSTASTAQEAAMAYVEATKGRVKDATQYTREAAASATERIQARVSQATQVVLDAKAGAFSRAMLLKESSLAQATGVLKSVSTAVGDVQSRAEKGLGGVRSLVLEYVEAARSKTLKTSAAVQATVLERTNSIRSAAASLTCHAQEHASKVTDRVKSARIMAVSAASRAVEQGQARALEVADITKTKAIEVGTTVRSAAGDAKVQATVASAAGGAVAMGSAGGATGLAAGTAIGATVGLVPALFTFGLSIPICAAIGGGTGLAVGTTVGGTAGAVGGGTMGYGVYVHKDEIRSGAVRTLAKANDCADMVKDKAGASVGYVKERASAAKVRLLGGARD